MLVPLLALHLLLAGATDPYELGLTRYREADYMGAAEQFRKSVSHPANPHRGAQANIWLGVCLFNINEPDAARLAFKSGLSADPTVDLPDDAPPTLQPLFDEVRRQLPPHPAGPAQPRAVVSVPFDRPEQPESHSDPVDVPVAHRDHTHEEGEPGSGLTLRPWMAAAVGGGAVALGATAGGLKLASSSNFDAARLEPTARRTSQLDSRGSSQQGAAVGLGIAAAGTLVAAGVIYLLAH